MDYRRNLAIGHQTRRRRMRGAHQGLVRKRSLTASSSGAHPIHQVHAHATGETGTGAASDERTNPVTDRFHLAATVDRLIYGDEETFRTEDALTVLDAMPKPTWRRFLPDIGFEMKSPGRSSSGAAAGFGNVTVRGEDR